MMDKFGNSNMQERIGIMDRYDKLFGFDTIDFLVADREFIGYGWLQYLTLNKITYHIRIRENFDVYLASGEHVKASWLFNKPRNNQFVHYPKIVRINQVLCYISASKIKTKSGKREFQFLISFRNPSQAKQCYSQRWQIETMFKALKTRGFNLEKTHLQDIKRIEKLVAVVFIAFLWCYLFGIQLNNIKPIPIKKHGKKAKSLFKYGLDYITKCLLNHRFIREIPIFEFLSCT